MAKDDWGSRPADQLGEHVTTLAWLLLNHIGDGGFNLYEEAKRLVSGDDTAPGSKKDADFWLDQIRGSAAPANSALADPWPHTPKGSSAISYRMVRTARIPYLIKKTGQTGSEEAQTHYLDHVLVGYTVIDTVNPVPVFNWKKDKGSDDLKKLGRFLAGDLWPGWAKKLRRVGGWQLPKETNSNSPNYNPYGYDESADYGTTSQPEWQFRELKIKIDKSVAVTVGVGAGANTREIAHLLIGYEGGGAW